MTGTLALLLQEGLRIGFVPVRWLDLLDIAITAVLVGAREPAHIDNALAAYEMGLDPDVRAHMSAWGDEKV